MSELNKITCDACQVDLTTSTNSIDYRIVFGNQRIPSKGGFVTDMMMHPHIEGGTKHFCNMKCFRTWLDTTPGKAG